MAGETGHTPLATSTRALLDTVSALTVPQLAEPSLLPGWTRAHVVAHLALNAEGFNRALHGLVRDAGVAVYDSGEKRDADIEELAGAAPVELRARLVAACTRFATAYAELPPTARSGSVPRVPGGPTFSVAELPVTRRREVEIHHADLDAGYTCAAWPADFCAELLDRVSADHAVDGPFLVRATDLGRDWQVGATGGPVVTGSAAALGWWLTGRGAGEGVACGSGALPRLGPWARPAAR